MPLLSDVQLYGADLMRKLRCARHDQMHRLLAWKYPRLQPERLMGQLTHLSRAINDGTHYLCQVAQLRSVFRMTLERLRD